jgi:predicted Abi (CAAX) family protease
MKENSCHPEVLATLPRLLDSALQEPRAAERVVPVLLDAILGALGARDRRPGMTWAVLALSLGLAWAAPAPSWAAGADLAWYRPVADWSGRLALPESNARLQGGAVWIFVENAPREHRQLVAKWAVLGYTAEARNRLARLYKDVVFTDGTRKSQASGNKHPGQLDGWASVSPLESLAGARDRDNVRVRLENVRVVGGDPCRLEVDADPVQIEGVEKCLVQLLGSGAAGPDRLAVRHYDGTTLDFTGREEHLRVEGLGTDPRLDRILQRLEKSQAGRDGWWLHGVRDGSGEFVVQALEPRALSALGVDRVVRGLEACKQYLVKENFADAPAALGTMRRVILLPQKVNPEPLSLQSGPGVRPTRFLTIHLFGGRGGPGGDVTKLGLVTGHFSFGISTPETAAISGESRIAVSYRQVYAHNRQGIVSGATDWHCYMGSLARGWAWERPVWDVLVHFELLDRPLVAEAGRSLSFLDVLSEELGEIEARFRTGDGDGLAGVSPLSNCSQDSAQGLYSAIQRFEVAASRTSSESPENRAALEVVLAVLADLKKVTSRFPIAPGRWRSNARNEKQPFSPLPFAPVLDAVNTLTTMFPRHAHDEYGRVFLEHGAALTVIHTGMLAGTPGGNYPLAPTYPGLR